MADDSAYLIDLQTDSGPSGREEDEHRQVSAGEILLVLEVLIRGDQEVIAVLLGFLQQGTVSKLGPPAFEGGIHLVAS
ncbi:hypothetical protein [Candidatus Palauibacter sp.]|uniref:hypothetical protein n=1 Tax=Candidatus Palauibacter sp. TaxID=3101350 RepID=UPI003B012C06